MRYYRLYCFDGVHRLINVHELEVTDDVQAVFAAREIKDGISSELWERDRLVRRFPEHDVGT